MMFKLVSRNMFTETGRKLPRFMTILGIGVDIVHLPRILNLLNRPRFARRILSNTETSLWDVLPNRKRAQFLAVRYVPHISNIGHCIIRIAAGV